MGLVRPPPTEAWLELTTTSGSCVLLAKQSNNNGRKGPLSHRTTGSNNTVASSDDYPCIDITVINPAVLYLERGKLDCYYAYKICTFSSNDFMCKG